jgi:hypothetical protein
MAHAWVMDLDGSWGVVEVDEEVGVGVVALSAEVVLVATSWPPYLLAAHNRCLLVEHVVLGVVRVVELGFLPSSASQAPFVGQALFPADHTLS